MRRRRRRAYSEIGIPDMPGVRWGEKVRPVWRHWFRQEGAIWETARQAQQQLRPSILLLNPWASPTTLSESSPQAYTSPRFSPFNRSFKRSSRAFCIEHLSLLPRNGAMPPVWRQRQRSDATLQDTTLS